MKRFCRQGNRPEWTSVDEAKAAKHGVRFISSINAAGDSVNAHLAQNDFPPARAGGRGEKILPPYNCTVGDIG
jgi:hypothetical protein